MNAGVYLTLVAQRIDIPRPLSGCQLGVEASQKPSEAATCSHSTTSSDFSQFSQLQATPLDREQSCDSEEEKERVSAIGKVTKILFMNNTRIEKTERGEPSPTEGQSIVLPWPPSGDEGRKKNWFAVYDPALDPKRSRGKDIIYRYDGIAEAGQQELIIKDPRIEARKNGKELIGRGMRKARSTLYTLEWEVSRF